MYVQPEKAVLSKFTLEYQMLRPSEPRTTMCSLFPIRAAAGLSLVVPLGRCCQLFQAIDTVLKVLYHIWSSVPLTTRTTLLPSAVKVGADGVTPLIIVQPEKALVAVSTDPNHMV